MPVPVSGINFVESKNKQKKSIRNYSPSTLFAFSVSARSRARSPHIGCTRKGIWVVICNGFNSVPLLSSFARLHYTAAHYILFLRMLQNTLHPVDEAGGRCAVLRQPRRWYRLKTFYIFSIRFNASATHSCTHEWSDSRNDFHKNRAKDRRTQTHWTIDNADDTQDQRMKTTNRTTISKRFWRERKREKKNNTILWPKKSEKSFLWDLLFVCVPNVRGAEDKMVRTFHEPFTVKVTTVSSVQLVLLCPLRAQPKI